MDLEGFMVLLDFEYLSLFFVEVYGHGITELFLQLIMNDRRASLSRSLTILGEYRSLVALVQIGEPR